MNTGNEELKDTLIPVVESLGCELWGLEFITSGKSTVLRIYIDKEIGKINLEDCERVSRQCGSILDVEDMIRGHYVLEVSSPGIDRPLIELNHFERFLGDDISLKLRFPFKGRRNFTGSLKEVDGGQIVISNLDDDYRFAFDAIDKANLVPRY